MIRRCLFVLGACCLLGACGSKFSSGPATAAGGEGGTGGNRTGAGGRAQLSGAGGADPMGQAGEDPAADAGSDAGGTTGDAGASSDRGGAGDDKGGAGGGPIAGTGGVLDASPIPVEGLALWFRADVGVQQTGGVVQKWLDQSGNKRDATQIGSARPQYLEKGLNGLPALDFDGVGDFLKLPNGFGDFSAGLAGFVIAQPAASDCASVIELSNGTEIDDIAFGMWENKWTYEVFDSLIHNGNVDQNAPSLYAVNHRPAITAATEDVELRINGSSLQFMQMGLPVVPDSKQRQYNFIGHTLYENCNYFQGQLSEFILYDRALSAAQVAAIESYLAEHWRLGPIDNP